MTLKLCQTTNFAIVIKLINTLVLKNKTKKIERCVLHSLVSPLGLDQTFIALRCTRNIKLAVAATTGARENIYRFVSPFLKSEGQPQEPGTGLEKAIK